MSLSQLPWVVIAHLFAALGALALGIVILSRRKGTFSHRTLGWMWVALMGSTALASVFIRDYRLPNIAGYTPIHLFTVYVLLLLPAGVYAARTHNVARHKRAMRGIFIGGCVVAGVFTLLPGRFLGALLWKQTLGLM